MSAAGDFFYAILDAWMSVLDAAADDDDDRTDD